jgi:hypothetical protein
MTSDCIAKGKKFIEANPHQAAGLGLLFGYILPLLPVSGLIKVFVKLILPSVFVLGVVKAFELLRPLCTGERTPVVSDNSEPLLDSPVGPSPETETAS